MNQKGAAPSPLKTYLTSLRGITLHLHTISSLIMTSVYDVELLLFVLLSVDLMNYVTKFQWDKAKYPTALPLSGLTEIINKVQVQVLKVPFTLNCVLLSI